MDRSGCVQPIRQAPLRIRPRALVRGVLQQSRPVFGLLSYGASTAQGWRASRVSRVARRPKASIPAAPRHLRSGFYKIRREDNSRATCPPLRPPSERTWVQVFDSDVGGNESVPATRRSSIWYAAGDMLAVSMGP